MLALSLDIEFAPAETAADAEVPARHDPGMESETLTRRNTRTREQFARCWAVFLAPDQHGSSLMALGSPIAYCLSPSDAEPDRSLRQVAE